MVTQSILDAVFSLVMSVLDLLPDISWTLDGSLFANALEWFAVVYYVLPMDTVFAILGITFALLNFRILVALIKTIWEVLPVV